MDALTKEQYEQLPDFVKSEYVQTDDGYKHGGVVKLKESLNNLDTKYKETEGRLSEFEQKQKEAIEAAQREAYEKAKKEGNIDEIEKRYQEQLEDAQKRVGETETQYKERLEKLTNGIKSEKINSIVADLAGELATDSGREAFKQLAKSLVDYDPEQTKTIFKGLDGSATSLDLEGFKADLKKNPVFAPLLKADVTAQGGGMANGNSNGSAEGKPKANMGGNKSERVAAIKQKIG